MLCVCAGGRCRGDSGTSRHIRGARDPADRDTQTCREQERSQEDDESQQHLPRSQNAGQEKPNVEEESHKKHVYA